MESGQHAQKRRMLSDEEAAIMAFGSTQDKETLMRENDSQVQVVGAKGIQGAKFGNAEETISQLENNVKYNMLNLKTWIAKIQGQTEYKKNIEVAVKNLETQQRLLKEENMKIGVGIRNMGPQSTRELLTACASAVEDIGLESIWITDHLAIPPDDAEGSGGRYLEILTTLAWLAGITKRVKIGSAVLVLPYRAALLTAKQIATVQELSGDRLVVGVGVGWMDPEFQALGVNRHARGRISDETLAFFNDCFAQDEVEANDQMFLFKPRPVKPPFLIGGRAPHALKRAATYGDGWFPVVKGPEDIASALPAYRALTKAANRPPGNITISTRLPLEDPSQTRTLCDQYQSLGVDRLVCGLSYDTIR